MRVTKIAVVGALLLLLTQTIDQEHAIESVDFNTIGLLAGMMLLVGLTSRPACTRGWRSALVSSRADDRFPSWRRPITTAVLSAFLDDLTTVLLMVPIT